MLPLDPEEPLNIASAISELNLEYAVLTSVNRDDLPDQGAGHFAKTIDAIRNLNPNTLIETLIPDFQCDFDSLDKIISVGFHRDNAYLAWYRPQEMATCWIALDPTAAVGGTVEFARGSHRWSTDGNPFMQFHAPDDHRDPMEAAAAAEGVAYDVGPAEGPAGGERGRAA